MPEFNPDDYKYSNKGKCPRCDGMLVNAEYFYTQIIFKGKTRCVACTRVWGIDKNKQTYLFQ